MFKKKAEKSESLKISNTFNIRCVCKWCKGKPEEYFFVRNPILFKNHKFTIEQFEYIRKNVKRMCNDYYLSSSPKMYVDIQDFVFPMSFKGYNPKLHRTRGCSNRTNVTEIINCACGKTSWSFNYKSTSERKEITMRQGNKRYT